MMGCMDWGRLGKAIRERRVELGHKSREAFARHTGISPRLLNDLELGKRTSYDQSTFVRLEQALEWRSGSVNVVLAGGTPLLPADPTDDVAFVIGNIERSDLPDAPKQALLRYARRVQQRQRQARDELSRRQAEERQALAAVVADLAQAGGVLVVGEDWNDGAAFEASELRRPQDARARVDDESLRSREMGRTQ